MEAQNHSFLKVKELLVVEPGYEPIGSGAHK